MWETGETCVSTTLLPFPLSLLSSLSPSAYLTARWQTQAVDSTGREQMRRSRKSREQRAESRKQKAEAAAERADNR
jgi:hypothetical protein